MAQDIFLKIDSIPGESTDKTHVGTIEILSFSLGASNSVNMTSAGAGAGTGKVNMQDVSLMMGYSKASPLLMLNCASGTHIPTATLFLRKAGGTQQEFLTYTLSEVFISSYNTSGSGEVPMDSVSLAFGKIEINYQQQDEHGAVGKPVKAGWNLKTNMKV